MSKIFFQLILFSIFTISLQAQEVMVSAEPIDGDGYSEARVIGQDDDGFYVLQSNLTLNSDVKRIGFVSRKLRVSYFNGMLKHQWTIPAGTDIINGSVDQVVFAFGKLLFICSAESKDGMETEAWIRQIDNHGLGPAPGKKVVIFKNNKSSTEGKLRFVHSENQQYAMIILKENMTEGKQLLHIAVLNAEFELLSNRGFILPYSVKDLTIEDYKISNEGVVALLGYLEMKNKNREIDKKKITEYHLFTILSGSEQYTDSPVNTEHKTLTQAGLAINNHLKEVVVMGFYSDNKQLKGTGVFYASLNLEKKPAIEIRTNPFASGQHHYISGERSSSNSSDVSTYPIQKIILRNDGGAVIMAEAAYTSEYSYYDYFTQTLIRHTDYHFDNIILVSVNKDCTIDWSYVIYKHQESSDDEGVFSSYCPLVNNEHIIITYNGDALKNQVAKAGLISAGGQQRDIDISLSTDHLKLLPTWGKQISEDEIVIPVFQLKKLFLCKIGF